MRMLATENRESVLLLFSYRVKHSKWIHNFLCTFLPDTKNVSSCFMCNIIAVRLKAMLAQPCPKFILTAEAA